MALYGNNVTLKGYIGKNAQSYATGQRNRILSFAMYPAAKAGSG